MRVAFGVAGILFPAVMACLVCLLWGCQTEEVADLSENVKTTDVMVRLAASSTQAEAEAAVRSLIVKTEMGETFPGSRYELYTFSDEDIAELAELHLLYASGELQPALGDTFGAMMRVARSIYMPTLEFDTAVSILREEVSLALGKPEQSSNALLLAIASEDGNLPETAPLYDENTVRSPVQSALFGIWLHREFADIPAAGEGKLAPGSGDRGKGHCSAKCVIKYNNTIIRCEQKWSSKPEKHKECIAIAEEHLSQCLEDCHDQGGS